MPIEAYIFVHILALKAKIGPTNPEFEPKKTVAET